jgi:hypothetical protein
MNNRTKLGYWLEGVGAFIGFGPIAVFCFIWNFPDLFDGNTVLLWGYMAMAFPLYGSIGAILIGVGAACIRSAKDPNASARLPSPPPKRTVGL